jgi:hypothetical protein
LNNQVQSERDPAAIIGDSNVLLEKLADTLVRTPRSKRIEVRGRTESRQERAVSANVTPRGAIAESSGSRRRGLGRAPRHAIFIVAIVISLDFR